MELVPHMKVWLSTPDGQSIIGSGRYRLLRAIQETGSLSAAAEELSISYRKAWGDLKRAEKHIGVKLVDKVRGGRGGGRTVLTREGAELLKVYSELVNRIEEFTQETGGRLMQGAFEQLER